MAPASLARRTSRDSRSASFLISSAVSGLPSSTPPLMTRRGLALAKSRRPLAASTGSPVMKAIAEGPVSWPSKAVTPASLAASWVSCDTVRPRYSVSTAAPELRNLSVSSAMAADFSGFAMRGLLPGECRRSHPRHEKSPQRRTRGLRADQDEPVCRSRAWPALVARSAAEPSVSVLTHEDNRRSLVRCQSTGRWLPGSKRAATDPARHYGAVVVWAAGGAVMVTGSPNLDSSTVVETFWPLAVMVLTTLCGRFWASTHMSTLRSLRSASDSWAARAGARAFLICAAVGEDV